MDDGEFRKGSMTELSGRTAWVTGAARGIGKTVALALAKTGCDMIVTDVNEDGIAALGRDIEGLGRRVLAMAMDVTDSSRVDYLIDTAFKTFDRIDILVNNAGITRDNLLIRMGEDEWDKVIQVNLKGAFLCTRKVLRVMMKQRSGKIINMASVVGLLGNTGQANYAASKAGLIGFTRSVAREVASRNIQANAVAPGFIETDMTANLPQDVKESFFSRIPLGRPGTPDDVAKAVLFLASKDSDYITGQVLNVDGGLVMGF